MEIFFSRYTLWVYESKKNQHIEVPLTYGLEFCELDPYFFTGFIKSTPEYQPLPVEIYNDYADGWRIIEIMLNLGKFEKIKSNIRGQEGIVVKDRPKLKVKDYKEGIWEIIKDVDFQKPEPSFWNKVKKMIKRRKPNTMQ